MKAFFSLILGTMMMNQSIHAGSDKRSPTSDINARQPSEQAAAENTEKTAIQRMEEPRTFSEKKAKKLGWEKDHTPFKSIKTKPDTEEK